MKKTLPIRSDTSPRAGTRGYPLPPATGTVLIAVLALVSCGSPPRETASGGLEGKLVLTGSSTVAPLAAEIALRFEALHPAVRIDVQTGGSSRGIADARSGTADIGMASRALKGGERDLHTVAIARDGVGVIVHGANPIVELTAEQVTQIYTGQIHDWQAVGGDAAPITVVHKADGRATQEVFLDHFDIDPADVRADIVIGDNQQGIKTVTGNPQAIGYVSIGAADYEARHGAAIRLLSLDGVEATPENVASGAFPISRALFLITREEPAGLSAAFIEFARSEAVDDLVEAQFFVPFHP